MKRLRHIFHHRVDVWQELRLLCNNGCIDIFNQIHPLLEHLTDFFQQFDAVCALIRRIIVRKMASDVPQCCSAEKRIHNGMNQHIRIGMSQKAIFIRDFHTAQNQFPVFHQFMHIVTHSYSHCSFLRFVTF